MKTYKEILSEKRRTPKEEKEYRNSVTMYQTAQYRKGNKITWDEAQVVIDNELKGAAKAAKKLKPKTPKTPKTPKEKIMSDAAFKKIMKGVAHDFTADFPDADLADMAWDIAGSLMYDPEINKYVRTKMAKNISRTAKPEDIKKERVQEWIADSIYG